MKLPQKLFILLLLVVVVTLPSSIEAKRRGKRRRNFNNKNKKGLSNNDCRYKNKGKDGECDVKTDTKMVFLKLKKRGSDPNCPKTKTLIKSCKDFSMSKKKKKAPGKRFRSCKYDRKSRQKSECDPVTNLVTITIPLKANYDTKICEPSIVKTKPCNKKKMGKRKKKGCVFQKQPWSECNLETNTMTREMKLVSGDTTQCQQKRLVTKPCRKLCRYMKGEWSACDTQTNLMNRTRTPKPGSAAHCQPDIQKRPCRASLNAPKTTKCKYSPGKWAPCDKRTNTRTQTMSLKNGDPNICVHSKQITRKCKVACKFRQGEWSECDEKTQLSTRVDTLVKGNDDECEATRQIHKKCRKACKYTHGDWGECDPNTNLRTRSRKLIKGDPKICQEEEIVEKPCTKRDGEAACFYGSWGDYGPCTNGVRMKHRPLISGGIECEKKAAATEACDMANR